LAREEGLSFVGSVGSVLTYECSVVGEGSTVWTGGGFDCPSTNDSIILRHTTEYNTTSRTCNSGSITGRGDLVDRDLFTSLLIIYYTPDLEGTNVTCIYDNGSIEVVIGTTPIVYDIVPDQGKSLLLHASRALMHAAAT
jgi:hypothetical protein